MACGKCGTFLSTANLLYDQTGNPICQGCLMAEEARDSQAKSAAKVKGIAYGGPVVGLAGLIFNPFGLMSVAAIANGLYVLRSVRQPDTLKFVEGSVEKIKVAAIAGMVLGAVTGLLRVLSVVAG